MNKKVSWLVKGILFSVIFALGVLGYYLGKGFSLSAFLHISPETSALFREFLEHIYETSVLFWVNPLDDAPNGLVLLIEIVAMMATVFIIVSSFTTVFAHIWNCLSFFWKKSTTVYGAEDDEVAASIVENKMFGFFSPKGSKWIYKRSKNHIIMLGDDLENLDFYERNKKKFVGKKVHIMLNQIDPFLLKSTVDILDKDKSKSTDGLLDKLSARIKILYELHKIEKYINNNTIDFFKKILDTHFDRDRQPDIYYFNKYELAARLYWKKYNLFDELANSTQKIEIAILGYGNLGKAILKFGYLNSIYSLNQDLSFYVYGCTESEKEFLVSLNDKFGSVYKDILTRIVCVDGCVVDGKIAFNSIQFDSLKKMNRIILAQDSDNLELLQDLLKRDGTLKIHCYCEQNIDISKLILGDNCISFGNMTEILTEKNIKSEITYQNGKWFNFDYDLRDGNVGVLRDCSPDKICKVFNKCVEYRWEEQNGFLKGSNFARADHYWIQKRIRSESLRDYAKGNNEKYDNLQAAYEELDSVVGSVKNVSEKKDDAKKLLELLDNSDVNGYAKNAVTEFLSVILAEEIDVINIMRSLFKTNYVSFNTELIEELKECEEIITIIQVAFDKARCLKEKLGADGENDIDIILKTYCKMCTIEHIRWCLFHFVNHWSYGKRDKTRTIRKHNLLVPYSELPLDDQLKDGFYCKQVQQLIDASVESDMQY